MSSLYRQIAVLQQRKPRLSVRYVCLEDLETGRFRALVCDFHHIGDGYRIDPQAFAWQQINALEVFTEQEAAAWTWHATLTEAIAQHEADLA